MIIHAGIGERMLAGVAEMQTSGNACRFRPATCLDAEVEDLAFFDWAATSIVLEGPAYITQLR